MRRFFVLAGVLTLIAASFALTTASAPKRTSETVTDAVPDSFPDPARPLEHAELAAASAPLAPPAPKKPVKKPAAKPPVKKKAKPKPTPKSALVKVADTIAAGAADTTIYPMVKCWNGKSVPDHPHVQDCPSRPKPKPQSIPAVWVRLVRCEANGDWRYGGPGGHTDPGYGEFEGGPNFLHSTWVNYGGGIFAAHAWGATPYQQVVIARKVLASEGVHAWPVCGPRAGLQRGD